jgi:hypothetical protein
MTKKRKVIGKIENISEVGNKIRYTHQEETYMKKNVMFNIISEIILLTVVQCNLFVCVICPFRSEEYYVINLTLKIICVDHICNTLILFPFHNLISL